MAGGAGGRRVSGAVGWEGGGVTGAEERRKGWGRGERDSRVRTGWRGRIAMIESLILSLTVFALAMFVGHSVITKVPPTLHTPLMSGTNAISGIVIVGALVAAGMTDSALSQGLATAAVVLATINVVGGFMVTDKMLRMFRRRERPDRAK